MVLPRIILSLLFAMFYACFFFQAEDGIRDLYVTGVQTCALPISPYAAKRFPEVAPKTIAWPVRDGPRTPGKVAIFSTCYVDYNEPGMGLDLLAILDHSQIPYVIAERQACCGMPKLELGDIESVLRMKDANAAG